MNKNELIKYLDTYLDKDNFKDDSKNGLQVDTEKSDIKKIWYSVDSNSYIFDLAIEQDIDLIISHHGIFWWFESPVTGLYYKRLNKLIKNDIALYASHLPLDAHSEVGNNIWLLKAFARIYAINMDNAIKKEFWEYRGQKIWFSLEFEEKVHISTILSLYAETMWLKKHLYNFWEKEYIKSIAFVSGGWADTFQEAYDKKIDLLITWEAPHYIICASKELGQSIMLAWHRETEKIWVKLLCHSLKEKFWLEIVFLDEKY